MLAEWFAYLTTPCPRHLRRMGYLREIIGTRSRFSRCRAAWRPHLRNSRAAILKAARQTAGRRKAVVLGSGWLFDVPLDRLSAMFEDVVLVDILHMPKVRRIAARYPNVRLVENDLTGVTDPFRWSAAGVSVRNLPGTLPEADADLVVSANLLSQLPYLPARNLRRECPGLTDSEVDEAAQSVIDHHLELLHAARGTVCLITEVEHLYCDGDTVLERTDPLYGIDPGRPTREWIWDVAPRPELHHGLDMKYRVISRIVPSG